MWADYRGCNRVRVRIPTAPSTHSQASCIAGRFFNTTEVIFMTYPESG
nr:MAG TPA: hypothetical protein [Caudoviricetes sp.]